MNEYTEVMTQEQASEWIELVEPHYIDLMQAALDLEELDYYENKYPQYFD